MTRKQLQTLIRANESQRDYAKKMLDDHYQELEDRDEETEWLNRYIKHKKIVEQLQNEKPDDE